MLESWLEGQSTPPGDVFLRAVGIISDYETQAAAAPQREKPGSKNLQLSIGRQHARCPNCDTNHFASIAPPNPLSNLAELFCVSCGFTITRGDLMVQLCRDVSNWSAAKVIASRLRASAL
jgi:hypothetical protein